MSDREFLQELIRRAGGGKGYFATVHLVACFLPGNLHEQLRQLVHGPVWDGDVVSKGDRDVLLKLGLAVRVTAYGEQGYTAATNLAEPVSREVEAIKAGRIHE